MCRQSGCGCLKPPHPHLYLDLHPVNLCPQSVHHSLPVLQQQLLHLCSGLEALHLLHTHRWGRRGEGTPPNMHGSHTPHEHRQGPHLCTDRQTHAHTLMYTHTRTRTRTHTHIHTHTHTYRVPQLPVAHFEQCLQVHLAEVHPGDLPPIHIYLSFETHTLSS